MSRQGNYNIQVGGADNRNKAYILDLARQIKMTWNPKQVSISAL